MKKIFFILISSVIGTLSAQENNQTKDVEAFKFGTNLSLGFYMYDKDIFFEVIPGISYWPTYWINAGTGVYYQYRKFFYEQGYDDINVYGICPSIKFYPLSEGFFVFEYRYLWYRTNLFNYPSYEDETIHVSSFIAGIGFSQAITERFFIHTLLLYDFLNDIKTPYSNPIFQTMLEYRFNLPMKKRKK